MRHPVRGLSLVELLVAIPIIVTALLAAGAGLGFGIRASQRGILQGRMALVLMSRLERLAADAEGSDSTCGALRDGSDMVDGIEVEWVVGPGGVPVRGVSVRARAVLRGVIVADSLEARLRCG